MLVCPPVAILSPLVMRTALEAGDEGWGGELAGAQ